MYIRFSNPIVVYEGAYQQHYNFVLLEDSRASDYREKYLPDRAKKGNFTMWHLPKEIKTN